MSAPAATKRCEQKMLVQRIVFAVVCAEAWALRTHNARNDSSSPLPLRITFRSQTIMLFKRPDEAVVMFNITLFDAHSLDFDAAGVQI